MRCRRNMMHIAVFAAVTLLLYLLMVLAATVPNAAIQKNMRRSAQVYENADRYAFSEDGRFQNVADNHADQMWLNIGWNMGFGNPFVSALNTGYFDGAEYGSEAALYMTVAKGRMANADYTRYWHGTAGLMRILHLFTDVQGVKFLGMLCLLLLLLNTLKQLVKDGHWELSGCLMLSLIWVQAWNLRLSVEYLPCFLICFALCPAYLHLERKSDYYLELLSVVSGTLTAHFDFLTTETVTILIPLILVIAVRSRERRLESPKTVLKMLLRCVVCWGLAYGGSFVVKWVAVCLATGENHFLAAVNSAAQRIGGAVTVDRLRKAPGFFMAIAANFSVLFEGASRTEYRKVIGYLVVIAVLIAAVFRMNQTGSRIRPGTVFLLLLGSPVLLRFGILANHSYMHAFFTYRALASSVLALLAVLLINTWPMGKEGDLREWN